MQVDQLKAMVCSTISMPGMLRHSLCGHVMPRVEGLCIIVSAMCIGISAAVALLQAVVKRIVEKGAASVKIDGPYGGAASLIQEDSELTCIIAGGIGVCTFKPHQ